MPTVPRADEGHLGCRNGGSQLAAKSANDFPMDIGW
jgi:hypothetical protein